MSSALCVFVTVTFCVYLMKSVRRLLCVWTDTASQNQFLIEVGVSDRSFISTLNCIYWELAPSWNTVWGLRSLSYPLSCFLAKPQSQKIGRSEKQTKKTKKYYYLSLLKFRIWCKAEVFKLWGSPPCQELKVGGMGELKDGGVAEAAIVRQRRCVR